MALVALDSPIAWPSVLHLASVQRVAAGLGSGYDTQQVLNSADDRVAFIGRVHWAGYAATKDIRKVHFRLGAVTAGTATFRVSLQDVDTANGPVIRPDGNVDENWTVATSSLTANAWNSTGNLSADRTAAYGSLLAVVLDFSAFTSGASIVVSGMQRLSAYMKMSQASTTVEYDGATWSQGRAMPNVVLEASDGTFGTFLFTLPHASQDVYEYHSGSTGDERGLEFVAAHTMKCCGAWACVDNQAAGRDFDIVLYEDSTAIATVSVDTNAIEYTSGVIHVSWAPVQLTAGNTYRLMVKPTTANAGFIYFATLADAGHRAFWHGTAAAYNQRTDGGAWGAASTTIMPYMGLFLSDFDSGAGGGGGGGGRGTNRGLV